VVLILILLLELLQGNVVTINFLALILILVITGVFILKSEIEQHPYFSSFWVESVPIFWLVILLLLRNFA
jgi:hypothetical protein